MSRMVGTVSRGIRAPIIRAGEDLAAIVTDSVLAAAADGGFAIREKDIGKLHKITCSATCAEL